MYNIAICDDEPIYLDQASVAIKEIFAKHQKNCRIDKFSSAELLLKKIESGSKKYNFIVLDILMDGQNGIDAAKNIRRFDGDVNIVFLTSSPDFVYKGYDANASGYILKPIDKGKFEEILKKDWIKQNKAKHIVIKEKGIVHKVKYVDLIYLESKGKKVEIATLNGRFSVYAKLSDFSEMLTSEIFVNCHKSYLINLEHVQRIREGNFYTAQGCVVPISRANFQNAKKSFIDFIGSST